MPAGLARPPGELAGPDAMEVVDLLDAESARQTGVLDEALEVGRGHAIVRRYHRAERVSHRAALCKPLLPVLQKPHRDLEILRTGQLEVGQMDDAMIVL